MIFIYSKKANISEYNARRSKKCGVLSDLIVSVRQVSFIWNPYLIDYENSLHQQSKHICSSVIDINYPLPPRHPEAAERAAGPPPLPGAAVPRGSAQTRGHVRVREGKKLYNHGEDPYLGLLLVG